MQTIKIYHSTGVNRFSPVAVQKRVFAGQVKADGLQSAMVKSQNFNKDWAKLNQRSTSVGDLLQIEHNFYMVTGMGFIDVTDEILENTKQVHFGIGEMVSKKQIERLNRILKLVGLKEFNSLVWSHFAIQLSYAYIHPCDEMRQTKNFYLIQKAFIKAYV